jgi:hypothetical protein
MDLDTKVFNTGHKFWKGYSGGHDTNILKSEKYFFLAETKKVAQHYSEYELCTYSLNRPIRLINLTRKTVEIILNTMNPNSVNYKLVNFAFLPGDEQYKLSLLKQLVNENLYTRYKNKIMKNANRVSFHETNKAVCVSLCSFMKKNKFDGYYYGGNKTFHPEIMICDASNKLLKTECQEVDKKNAVYPENKHVIFAKNILGNPKVTLKELRQLEFFPLNANANEIYKLRRNIEKNIYLKMVSNANSLNTLARIRSSNANVKNAITKKKNLLQLSNRVKKLFNTKVPNKK